VIASRLLQVTRELPTSHLELARQGQVVFSPPDVSGWPSGLTWITASALLSRMNFASDAVQDFDPLIFGPATSAESIVDNYLRNLGPISVDNATRQSLLNYLAPGGVLPTGNTLLSRLRGLAHLILSLPEWQML
jgi:hypothetical protein